MNLAKWLEANHPGRGGRAWLARTAPTSFSTIKRALSGEPLNNESAASRIAAATDGAVSADELMGRVKRRRRAAA